MNLALCATSAWPARRARFDTRFLELGLHPGGGHTGCSQRIVGPQAAVAMVLFGEVLDGEAAAAAGLVWRCVDDDELLDEARRVRGQGRERASSAVDQDQGHPADDADGLERRRGGRREYDAQSWSFDTALLCRTTCRHASEGQQPEAVERSAQVDTASRSVTGSTEQATTERGGAVAAGGVEILGRRLADSSSHEQGPEVGKRRAVGRTPTRPRASS